MTLKFEYSGLKKVISGGQTGADQGGIAEAFSQGVLTGGTAPKGFRVTGGSNVLLELLGLVEDPSPEYPPRTEANVKNSDGTLVVAADLSSAGELLTERLCVKHSKPRFVVSVVYKSGDQQFYQDLAEQADRAARWLVAHQIRTLNVAGNRDHTGQTAMYDVTRWVVNRIFSDLEADNLLIRDTDL